MLSTSNSEKQNLESSNNQNPTSSYLVIDNDADKENIRVGEYVTWILEAQNFGPDMSKNVKVHDNLPKGLTYVKHTATKGTFNPNTGIWDIGDLTVEDGLITLLITAKAITAGEKVNEAYITSDTTNTNDETFEQEEIDVFSDESSQSSGLDKHVSAKMYATGNPILLIFACLAIMLVPIVKR